MTGNKLSKKQRIVKASLFREAFAQNRSFVGRYMVLWIREAGDASLRLGVVTSKKVSRLAVERNRVRRVLRAVFRENREMLEGNADVVIVGRRSLLSAEYREIEAEFLRLAGRAGLYRAAGE